MQHSTRLVLQTRLANTFAALRAARQPMTVAHLAEVMGTTARPVWEIAALESVGAVRRVANTVGRDCVDGRFEARPMSEWHGSLSTAVDHRA